MSGHGSAEGARGTELDWGEKRGSAGETPVTIRVQLHSTVLKKHKECRWTKQHFTNVSFHNTYTLTFHVTLKKLTLSRRKIVNL